MFNLQKFIKLILLTFLVCLTASCIQSVDPLIKIEQSKTFFPEGKFILASSLKPLPSLQSLGTITFKNKSNKGTDFTIVSDVYSKKSGKKDLFTSGMYRLKLGKTYPARVYKEPLKKGALKGMYLIQLCETSCYYYAGQYRKIGLYIMAIDGGNKYVHTLKEVISVAERQTTQRVKAIILGINDYKKLQAEKRKKELEVKQWREKNRGDY